MKKIFYLKVFTVICIVFLTAMNALAFDNGMNTLSRIIIEPHNGKEITLNMLFNEEYKGNAFIQKITDGSYYVFLPDTITAKNGTKIHYVSGFDRNKIKINVNQNEAIKDNKNTHYIRINVDMANDYPINLISGLNSNYNEFLMQLKSINIFNTLSLFAIFAIIFMIFYLTKKSKNNNDFNSYTSVPKNFLNSIQDNANNENNEKTAVKEKNDKKEVNVEIKKTEKAEKTVKIEKMENIEKNVKNEKDTKDIYKNTDNSFECFNIPIKAKKEKSSYEIKSTLNQTSKLLNNNPGKVKLKHTNPILISSNSAPSDLLIPAVDEYSNKTNQKNIISQINISQNKGFYITAENNKTLLYGFIKDKEFLIKEFNNISQYNLQARYYDVKGNKETYIVRLDNYKAMIEISATDIRELATL